jgi:TPR repeat protein
MKKRFCKMNLNVEELKKAAEQGDVGAQYALAGAYRTGRGVERSSEKAVYWLKKAAALGHKGAQIQLADSYEEDEDEVILLD